MYNDLSTDYDRFVNWQNRLPIELPFILEHLRHIHATSVLDAATGTGMHAIALARQGYQAAGADISSGMIEKARANATLMGVEVHFEQAGFTSLASVFGKQSFEALLCLGNSLPHILSLPELNEALHDFAACLPPGGLLLVQNRNFDSVMRNQARWMEPQSHAEAGAEWIFQRFYDFDPDGLLTFNMITLKRLEGESWTQKVVSSRLRPLLRDELISSLREAGFENIKPYGSMSGESFDPDRSGNLVITAHLPNND